MYHHSQDHRAQSDCEWGYGPHVRAEKHLDGSQGLTLTSQVSNIGNSDSAGNHRAYAGNIFQKVLRLASPVGGCFGLAEKEEKWEFGAEEPLRPFICDPPRV